jgi:hypothetical protein
MSCANFPSVAQNRPRTGTAVRCSVKAHMRQAVSGQHWLQAQVIDPLLSHSKPAA